MDKENVVHIYKGILLSYWKEQNNAIAATWMQLEISILKWSKSDTERQIPRDITHVWNLKYGTNEPLYETDSQTWRTDFWLQRREGVKEGRTGCLGLANVNYLEKHQGLLCSTGNYIQYPVINRKGK